MANKRKKTAGKSRPVKSAKNRKSLQRLNFAGIFSHWAFIGAACSAVAVMIVVGGGWAYAKNYESRIYPGVNIGSIELGGLTAEEAREVLRDELNAFLDNGFDIAYQEKKLNLQTSVIDQENPINNRELILYDYDQMVANALAVGRNKPLVSSVKEAAWAKTFGITLPAEFEIDEKSILSMMRQYFQEFDEPARDAQIIIDFVDNSNTPNLKFEEEQSGNALYYDSALAEIERQSLFIDPQPIELAIGHQEPKITLSQAKELADEMEAALELAPITLAYSSEFENLEWQITKRDFSTWLTLVPDGNGEAKIGFMAEAVKTGMEEISASLEVEPQDAKFKMEDERVIEFSGHRNGIKIDWDETLAGFEENILNNHESRAEVKVAIDEPDVKIGDLNELGIKEIVGIGRSNFSGSPVNRRHNIRVGTEKLSGLLIAPDEEFTTITNLSPVTAAGGYLPELVIKENKTIPEYGGGLCQIGTTMFRVALSAGLPITERKPHSYRVSYYEPAGKDAAVYEMHPDVRFINDTDNYLLVQGRIQGDELIFELWGTHDGREVYQSDSRIYNITGAPPLKEVPTTDLEPGQRKCTESAHAGADAEFDYKVTYPDGEVMEETFFSHYRAWGAVCLIGVEELPAEEGEEGTEGEPSEEGPAEEEIIIPE